MTREWDEAIAAFSRAVTELTQAMDNASEDDIQRLRAHVAQLREAAQEARDRLDSHLNEHGCEGSA